MRELLENSDLDMSTMSLCKDYHVNKFLDKRRHMVIIACWLQV